MKLVLYTVLIASSFACNENQTSQENPVSDVQVIPDRGDSSAVAVDAEDRASDVSVPDQNLPDALTIDMAVVCASLETAECVRMVSSTCARIRV